VTISSAHAWGIATVSTAEKTAGTVLDVWYPDPIGGGDKESVEKLTFTDADRQVERVPYECTIENLSQPPADTYDAFLRLHLLSARAVKPNEINLDGIFGVLNNVVWTNFGPCLPEGFELTRAKLQQRGQGQVIIFLIDKFPRMVDYVVPSGVRIGNADRIRLGAHLAEGTTVMHEGFVNYNAGTLGASMVEGRVSQGVIVDDQTDIGGGASTMGTLSGGGKERVRLGKRCLLGANSGLGIALGDDCAVEAGLYVTAGSKVLVDGEPVKAATLSGKSNMLFRRNSLNGAIEVVPWKTSAVALNDSLHKN